MLSRGYRYDFLQAAAETIKLLVMSQAAAKQSSSILNLFYQTIMFAPSIIMH